MSNDSTLQAKRPVRPLWRGRLLRGCSLLGLVLSGQAAWAQGLGDAPAAAPVASQASDRQDLPAFNKLQLDGAMDLQLVAVSGSASLEAPKGRVRVWVDGETLHLMAPTTGSVASDLGLQARPQLRLFLPTTPLHSIEMRGASQVRLGSLEAPRLTLVISGSGGLSAECVDAGQLDLALHGSGHLKLGQVQARRLSLYLGASGQVHMAGLQTDALEARLRASGGVKIDTGWAQQQEWVISGSGDVHAAGLQGQQASLRSYGSGDAELGRLDRLKVTVYGSGDVSYAGNPVLQLSMPGSGSLRARPD